MGQDSSAEQDPSALRILTRDEMRAAEAAADAAGTSYEQLMENAGKAAAREILSFEADKKTAFLLCGKGNNAGDAFVIARVLAAEGWQVTWIPLCGEEMSELAALNLSRMPESVAQGEDYTAAVIVDGVFGTGFRGELPAPVREVFRRANRACALRVALDLPSGLDCDTGEVSPDTFQAEYTLTFGAYKPGLLSEQGKPCCGEIRCLDIGLKF